MTLRHYFQFNFIVIIIVQSSMLSSSSSYLKVIVTFISYFYGFVISWAVLKRCASYLSDIANDLLWVFGRCDLHFMSKVVFVLYLEHWIIFPSSCNSGSLWNCNLSRTVCASLWLIGQNVVTLLHFQHFYLIRVFHGMVGYSESSENHSKCRR